MSLEHHDISNLIKPLFADDESVVSSTICEDPAEQIQIQSHDELTNSHPSNTIETSRNDNVSILGSECVAEMRLKKENAVLTKFTKINGVYDKL